jgi:hypothetical protein
MGFNNQTESYMESPNIKDRNSQIEMTGTSLEENSISGRRFYNMNNIETEQSNRGINIKQNDRKSLLIK